MTSMIGPDIKRDSKPTAGGGTEPRALSHASSNHGGAAESARDVRLVSCDHAERCGGCPAIGLPYGEQIELKHGRVEGAVLRYRGLDGTVPAPVLGADPIVEYRTRAKLIVAPSAKIGLFAKGGGHNVIDIPGCRVLSPALSHVAAVLREVVKADELSNGPLAPYDPPGSGSLRAVDLREAREGDAKSARVLVTFVVQRTQVTDLDPLRAAARNLAETAPSIVGVAVNFHDGDMPQILGNETTVLFGVSTTPDRVGASTHLATFGSFVQAHRGQAGRIHALLAEALELTGSNAGASKRVLDLYGGSGAIALSVAGAGASVHMVESFSPAVANAQASAKASGVKLSAECSDVSSALRGLVDKKAKFDAAVVNPPRRGMSPAAREWLARLDVQTIVYVSCDPDTLARDMDHLRRLGFSPTAMRPVDMIPLTDEVETVAVLRRTSVLAPRVVFENDEVLVVEKAAHEPTTPQGEYAGSLLARVRRIPGAENATPVHRLDIGTSGLVMLAKAQAHVQRWTDVLNAATTRKVYVAAVRGVTPSKGAITRDLREEGKLYPARTRYRRLAVASGHSVLRVIPEQGRTHQIRRHLAAIGHPVLGDERYGHAPTNRFFEEKNGLDRAFLHCVRVELDDPTTHQRLILEAPLPGDLRAVLERTSGPGTLKFLDHKNALGTTNSSMPPPPDSKDERASALDVDTSTPSVRPEMIGDDDG